MHFKCITFNPRPDGAPSHLAKLFSEGPMNTLDWFNFLMLQNNAYCITVRKGPAGLKHQIGPLAKSPIISR